MLANQKLRGFSFAVRIYDLIQNAFKASLQYMILKFRQGYFNTSHDADFALYTLKIV